MVFPMETPGKVDEQTDAMKHCINNMLRSGLEIFPYPSVQVDEIYVLIRCPKEILKSFAGKVEFKLLANRNALKNEMMMDHPELKIAPKEIRKREVDVYGPYEHIHLKYDPFLPETLYFSEEERDPEKKVFTSVLIYRLKLIYYMLRAPVSKGGCNLELSKLLHKKEMKAFFPLHDKKASETLKNEIWAAGTWPWDIKVDSVKDYFGEKIALYYVFIAHYSLWLLIPSITGLAFQLVVWATSDTSSPVLPFYSLLITVWSVFMLEYWKRKENITSLRWGTIGFEKKEPERPEFYGKIENSHIDGSLITYYDPNESVWPRASKFIVGVFMTLVLTTVSAIYVLRFTVLSPLGGTVSSLITSVINTVQITVFNLIYQAIAIKLTDKENHRTDTEYEDALITKLFVFQFINSFSSFFFLAFIASYIPRPAAADESFRGACGATTCMEPLMINLGIIFGIRLTLTNALEIVIPYVLYKLKLRTETAGIEAGTELTNAEKDYTLMPYVINLENIKNYADTAIQYGFTLLFIPALPCAAFLALLNNYAKLKFEAWKQFSLYQRPVPVAAQDIGTWQSVFGIISFISVITNAGLIVFTMDLLWNYDLSIRMWIFIGFQWVLIMVQMLAAHNITDNPEEVEEQANRMEFIESKIVKKVPDDDYYSYAEWKTHHADEYTWNEWQMQMPDDEDNESKSNPKKNFLGCCRLNKHKTLFKGLTKDLKAFPIRTYPDSKGNGWPEPTTRTNFGEDTGQGTSTHYNQFISQLPAVGESAKQEGREAEATVKSEVRGYRAVTTSEVTYY